MGQTDKSLQTEESHMKDNCFTRTLSQMNLPDKEALQEVRRNRNLSEKSELNKRHLATLQNIPALLNPNISNEKEEKVLQAKDLPLHLRAAVEQGQSPALVIIYFPGLESLAQVFGQETLLMAKQFALGTVTSMLNAGEKLVTLTNEKLGILLCNTSEVALTNLANRIGMYFNNQCFHAFGQPLYLIPSVGASSFLDLNRDASRKNWQNIPQLIENANLAADQIASQGGNSYKHIPVFTGLKS
jgi:GGDEF domain-containing protein